MSWNDAPEYTPQPAWWYTPVGIAVAAGFAWWFFTGTPQGAVLWAEIARTLG